MAIFDAVAIQLMYEEQLVLDASERAKQMEEKIEDVLVRA